MRADCTFDKTAGAAVNGTGNVLFHRCTFASTMVLPAASAPFAGALTATNGTQVALEATSFSGTTGGADVALAGEHQDEVAALVDLEDGAHVGEGVQDGLGHQRQVLHQLGLAVGQQHPVQGQFGIH